MVPAQTEELLAEHGYRALRADPVFGPFLREGEKVGLDAVSPHALPRELRGVLFAPRRAPGARQGGLPWLEAKRKAAEIATAEALQLMAKSYNSRFIDLAQSSLTAYENDAERAEAGFERAAARIGLEMDLQDLFTLDE